MVELYPDSIENVRHQLRVSLNLESQMNEIKTAMSSIRTVNFISK